jgi:hypothetical protein
VLGDRGPEPKGSNTVPTLRSGLDADEAMFWGILVNAGADEGHADGGSRSRLPCSSLLRDGKG